MEWYQNISKSKDAGTKLMGFSGRVKIRVCGTAVRHHRTRDPEDYAGGMRDGLKFKAQQPRSGTDFLTEAHLDLPMEFESIGKAEAVWVRRWR